mmetsp:Transcript_123051/g.213365  ORF Transcript_123051/g.213365 Transcript_123051/m.213365 type:complete len:352 (-) Transcript_123051:20-1075(-)
MPIPRSMHAQGYGVGALAIKHLKVGENVLLGERNGCGQGQPFGCQVQRLHFRVAHGPAEAADVGLGLLQAADPRDWHSPLGPAPVQSHLDWACNIPTVNPMGLCHIPHCLQQCEVCRILQVLLGELRTRALGQVRGAVLASEQPQAQRGVRQDFHPQLVAGLLQAVGVGVGVQQAVLDLVAGEGDPTFSQFGMNRADGVGPVVGDTHGLHQPQLVALRKAVPVRFVGPCVGEMNLVQLDLRLAKALQAILAGLDHVGRLQPPGEGPKLGSDLHIDPASSRKLSEQRFAAAKAIDLRRVEERDAMVDEIVEGVLQLLVVLGVVPPEEGVPPGPAPNADLGDGEGRGSTGHEG